MQLVSVIVPTHNRAMLLGEAIESILAIPREDFEIDILVIDDGSTDNTVAVTQRYPVRYLRLEGEGASAARNAGLQAARGDFIAFLDDDDVWLPENLKPQLTYLNEHPECGLAHCVAIMTDDQRVPFGSPPSEGPTTAGWLGDELLSYWPQLGTIVVRAEVVRECGGFDTSLRSEEEWDWVLRIAQRYQIARIERPVMLFRTRSWSDEELAWSRLPDTLKVMRRYGTGGSVSRRYRMWRRTWKHRGWYASQFLLSASHHAQRGERAKALRCVRYAASVSPLHTLRLAVHVRNMGVAE